MSNDTACLSFHASLRSAQRRLSEAQIDYVIQHGEHIHRTGITFVALSRQDIPPADLSRDVWAKLEGVIVLLAEDGTVITTYRHRRARHHILTKSKYRRDTTARR